MQALDKAYIPWQLSGTGEETAFIDLPVYHDATAFCLEKGLMDAYPTGYFLPARGSTVAEAAEMMWRVAGKPEPDGTQEGFADVGAGSEHEKAALWAKQAGVYAGKDGNFRGGDSLTWGALREMAKALLHEDVLDASADSDTAMTRADLAAAGRPVYEEWERQHPKPEEAGAAE